MKNNLFGTKCEERDESGRDKNAWNESQLLVKMSPASLAVRFPWHKSERGALGKPLFSNIDEFSENFRNIKCVGRMFEKQILSGYEEKISFQACACLLFAHSHL